MATYASIPRSYSSFLAIALIVAIAFLAPFQVVEARGGFALSFIISIVASIALTAISGGALAPITGSEFFGNLITGQIQNAFSSALGSIGNIFSEVGTLITTGAGFSSTVSGQIINFGVSQMIGTIGADMIIANSRTADVGRSVGGYNVYVTTSDLSQIEVGGGANLSGTITNNGPEPIVGSFTNRFQIFPTSQILDSSQDLAQANPLVATVANGLSVGESVVVTAYWNVPSDFNPGQYFLRLCANVNGGAAESNSGNNCGELQAFTVVSPPETGYAPSDTIVYTGFRIGERLSEALADGIGSLVAIANAADGGDLTSGTPSIYPAPKRVPEVVLCPFGYYFKEGVHLCIPEGYGSCGYVGYPDRVCPSGSFCRKDGQCESGTAGQNCKAGYNQPCQTAANSCGMTGAGFGSCDGSCQAVTPAESLCAVPKIELTTEPRLVNFKTTCRISWVLSDYQKCTLTGPGVSEVIYKDRPKGSIRTAPLEFSSVYTMACINGAVVKAEKSAECTLNPRFQEI